MTFLEEMTQLKIKIKPFQKHQMFLFSVLFFRRFVKLSLKMKKMECFKFSPDNQLSPVSLMRTDSRISVFKKYTKLIHSTTMFNIVALSNLFAACSQRTVPTLRSHPRQFYLKNRSYISAERRQVLECFTAEINKYALNAHLCVPFQL